MPIALTLQLYNVITIQSRCNLLSGYFPHLSSWSAWSWEKLINKETWKMVVTH